MPSEFTISTARFFLKEVEDVFKWNNQEKKNFQLEMVSTEKIDIFGQLLLYLKSATIIQYTIKGRFMSR
jgi:hypothetical protein